MKPYSIITLLLCLAFSAGAQKLDIPAGKAFEITKHIKETGTYKRNELYTYAFKSLGKDKDGNNLLEGKIVRVIYYDGQKGTIILNTDSIRNANFSYSNVLQVLAVLNQPFTLTVSPAGKVLATDGLQQKMQESLEKWHIKDDTGKMLLNNINTEYTGALNTLFYTPKQPEAKKTSSPNLQNSDVKVPLIVSNIGANTIHVHSSSATDTNSHTSEFFIDKKTGLTKNSESKQYARLKAQGASAKNKDVIINATVTMALTGVRVRPPVDTAWINMASKLSYWSDYYKKGMNNDPKKVLALVNAPDSRFMSDKYYRLHRLQLVQSLRSESYYKLYDSILLTTPNKYLEGDQAQLHNKLSSVLYKEGAAAAYELSKYAYKTDAFDDWLQHTFAQYFREDSRNKDAAVIKQSYDLLALFKTNTDPVYLGKITPLYLWAMAKQHKIDPGFLTQTAHEFEKMDDKHMLAGNGGRYALLVYKMMISAKQTADANRLIDVTINKLERYTSDTLNTYRYAHQNLLAGAFYLKYINQSAAGDPDATRFLASAAKYSPLAPTEKAYASNYDRFMLGTKESYRELFIDKLLNAGNEAEALKLFAAHVNAMPEQIVQMQALYAKKFPGKDFKQFFNDHIISEWVTAPAFSLKGVDGKQHNLTDYKNQWLVIDFWGTWCGPCREEMPVVNKFSNAVTAGDYPNVNFLSIACNDTENAVKAYLDETKFTIPVLLSDGLVQTNYKIRGYPSKIVISPQGRMITVDFGKDWQTVIRNFSQM
ncbi:TlpA family protein disulfide reductase [Mucilaginibacter boryungensis]|uniref:TlpA family protein disulfide reductase n=1 Tax=Mucilaginibacter boryungensis TaxID=768480 RepID=A0ABR9XGP6_9SPHI|nr:TlpA disulfide reductase family protein [Mucilaginibacter boryungensis]MBE9666554.1 TlpA family protein disulfide reductase [Mucilaginibacter boryungensis]